MDVYGTCHCGRCLAAFGEAYPDLEYPTGFEHDNHAVLTELNGRYLRTLAGRYARLVGEEPAQFARYFPQALARGARPSAVVIGRPATEHFSAFERSTPVLEIYRGNRDLYADLRPCAPVTVVRRHGDMLLANDVEQYARACEMLAAADVRADLGDVTAPTLVIGGSADIATPPDAQERYAAGIPGARLLILDGIDHMATAAAPERLAREITAHAGTNVL